MNEYGTVDKRTKDGVGRPNKKYKAFMLELASKAFIQRNGNKIKMKLF